MSSEKFDAGLAVRRSVMGDSFVDAALAGANTFTQPLQRLVTENCWGETWANGVLPKQTRSLVTLGILAALKAPNELAGHVRGALRNGCSVEEIQDVLLHATIYCGAPAGIDAFRAARPVIESWQTEQPDA